MIVAAVMVEQNSAYWFLTANTISYLRVEGSVCLRKKIKILALSAMLLCSASIASAESFQIGDQGTDVAEIQGQLSNYGYDVAADGDFGPATAEAVKEFQAAHGLAVDGLVGPSTYEALLGKAMPQVSRGSNYFVRRIGSAERHRQGSTAPALSATSLPMQGSISRVRQMRSMRSAIQSRQQRWFPAISSFSPRMTMVRRTSASTSVMATSSMLRRAVGSRLIICTAAIGAHAISVHVA